MSVPRQDQTTVTTTATALPLTKYPGWILKNNGSEILYLGDSAVTAADGFPVAAAATFSPELPEYHRSLRGIALDQLYGITSTGTTDVRVFLQSRPNV